MTYEQERRLRAKAERQHKPIEVVLDDFLADAPEVVPTDKAEYVAQRRAIQKEKNKGMIALLEQWRQEDAALSDEEKDKATVELNELLANLQTNRIHIGREITP